MKFKSLVYSLFIILSFSAAAQKVELGIHAGLANYTGDLAQSMVMGETKYSGGIFARVNLNNTWALTAIGTQLRIGGSDENFSYNKPRNIKFRTDITEFAGLVEFNYFKYGTGVNDKRFSPYVYWGLGAAFFNPQGMYNNQWYDLRQYQTEGKAYSGVAVVMPMGIGVKWMPNKKMSLEGSIGLRKTYTDYLDDVSNTYVDPAKQLNEKGVVGAALADPSYLINEGAFLNKEGYQRGNPDFNDFYFVANISVTYRIFTRIKCARFY